MTPDAVTLFSGVVLLLGIVVAAWLLKRPRSSGHRSNRSDPPKRE